MKMKTKYKTIMNIVKRRREELGVTQREISAIIGISYIQYNRAENGKSGFNDKYKYELLCEIFGINAEDLTLLPVDKRYLRTYVRSAISKHKKQIKVLEKLLNDLRD